MVVIAGKKQHIALSESHIQKYFSYIVAVSFIGGETG
jgi:hypothetical protein